MKNKMPLGVLLFLSMILVMYAEIKNQITVEEALSSYSKQLIEARQNFILHLGGFLLLYLFLFLTLYYIDLEEPKIS